MDGFDLVFKAMMAWNQIGMLLVVLVCAGVGGIIVGDCLLWFLFARRIPARVKAVYVTGEVKGKGGMKAQGADSSTRQAKRPGKRAFAVFIVLPLIFSAFGVYKCVTYFDLTAHGVHAMATVVRNAEHHDSENGTSYRAVVSFVDGNGQHYEVEDSISYGKRPSYAVGTKIWVYYDQKNPKHFVIDDFWHNMAVSLILIAFGLGFIVFILFIMHLSALQEARERGDVVSKGFYGEVYYALYEYRKPDGEAAEYMEENGSNQITKKMPGTRATLLMMPSSGKITRIGFVIPVIGLIFLGAGMFVANQFLATFEFNLFVLILALALFGFVGFKIKAVFEKIPSDVRKGMLARFKEKRFGTREGFVSSFGQDSPDVHKKGRMLEEYELPARVKYARKQVLIGSCLGVIIGLGLLGGAYYAGQDMVALNRGGYKTTGIVKDFDYRRSGNSRYLYYAQIEFTDLEGRKVDFDDHMGSNSPTYRRGAKVAVLYMPESPARAIIDHGIWNWALSVLLGALGVFVMLVSLKGIAGGRRASRV